MTIATYIYQDFENDVSSTKEFYDSLFALDLVPLNVAYASTHVGNREVLRILCDLYKSLQPDEPVCYADGADSFFLDAPKIFNDRILYSTEKAIWPPTDEMREIWSGHEQKTPWCYLNGGGYCGPAGLLAEFFEKYVLQHHFENDAHAQGAQAKAYFQAISDGFPIMLDQECLTFQSIAFSDPGDFSIQGGRIINNFTGSFPTVIHGNGRTPMGWVYDLKKQEVEC